MVQNERDAPTPEEVKLLIERAEAKDPELATLLFVAATTGCRRGELCGLRWSDADFEKGVLLVRRSVSDLPGRVEIRSTKTGHIRKMALDSATLSVLELLRDRAGARSAALGVTLDPDAYLWSSAADGLSPLRPGGVTSRFIALRNDLGLTHIRLHHLRHFDRLQWACRYIERRCPQLAARSVHTIGEANDARRCERRAGTGPSVSLYQNSISLTETTR